MQPRRRRVGSSSSRPPGDVVYEDLVMPDHDMCCRETITPEELRVYDDSDEDDEAARRKYQEMLNAPRRKPVSDNHAYMLLFVLLCGVLFVVNLRSQRELAKIKSNMGYEEKKASPQMWWNSAIIYYLHPATFRDSNDDGIGDLRGNSPVGTRRNYVKTTSQRRFNVIMTLLRHVPVGRSERLDVPW